jgi:hypothetical protein
MNACFSGCERFLFPEPPFHFYLNFERDRRARLFGTTRLHGRGEI